MTRDDQKGSELGTDTCLDVADEASLRRNGRCLVRVAGQDVAVLVSAALRMSQTVFGMSRPVNR